MLPEVEQLLVLQDRDKKIRALQRELETMPEERRMLDAKLANTASALDQVKLKSKELEVERKKLEIEAQTKRDGIARYKTQQFQTRKNEEFQALSNEIARYEKDIEAIEDREIVLMEDGEALKPKIVEADRQAAHAKQQVSTQMADLEVKKKTIEEQLSGLKGERQKLVENLDEDLLDHYQRLFASKGEAVVGLDREICMGCHMKITTQTAVRVKSGREVVHCDQCGRILYYAE